VEIWPFDGKQEQPGPTPQDCTKTETWERHTIDVVDAVRVLGVLITPDLSLDKHVTAVNAKCYFQLRQLRRVRCSLDEESVATLVHAFVTSRIDYCNGLLAGAPKAVTNKLQRVNTIQCNTIKV